MQPALFTTGLGAWALQGCSASSGLNASSGPWLLLTFAAAAGLTALVALVAVMAYRWGAFHAGESQRTALRQLRAERMQQAALQDAVVWRSNAAHELFEWRAPLAAEPSLQVDLTALPVAERRLSALFARAAASPCETTLQLAPPLAPLLAAQQAFSALRVQCNAAQHFGAQAWVLRASPCFDDGGQFAGYVGQARACDADDALRADAAALAPLLALHPAVVAVDSGAGWTLRQVSPAAHSRWPTARIGTPAAHWLRAVPAVLSQTLQTLQVGQRVEVEGWRLSCFDLPGAARGVLMVMAGSSGPAPLAGGGTGTGTGPVGELAEHDNFSITVAHDLRAPIRVVDGFTRIVKEDYGHLLDRVCNDHLDRVLGAAARMNLMIDAMLTLARLSSQPLARQPVNLSQLAGFVIDDLKRAAPEREVDVEIEAGLAAQGDPTLLRLVLENLLGNAWKYTVRCPRAQISVRRFEHAGATAFEVRDNGAGFDMRSAERLFGLFQRLHSANDFPGHGVGLASVKRIVSRHGGDIWAEAEPGKGAAFRFTLAD